MHKRDYAKALKSARDDLEGLFRKRDRLERLIARTREAVIRLSFMVEGNPDAHSPYLPGTLTEACQYALVASKVPLDPITIRSKVERDGFDIGSSNPLASIHGVLNRLVEQKILRRVYRLNPDGSYQRLHHYWWGDDAQLPTGWIALTKAEYNAGWKGVFKDAGKRDKAEYDVTTQKLAKAAARIQRAAHRRKAAK